MTLNIVRKGYGDTWKVITLSEDEYRETPKQFRFKKVDGYFDHVDKDLENVLLNNEGYVFSRIISVLELKKGYLGSRLNRLIRNIDLLVEEKESLVSQMNELKSEKDN